MCRSQAEGGQRCAAHTRARLDKCATRLQDALRSGDTDTISDARVGWERAAAEYASTREGRSKFEELAATARDNGDIGSLAMFTTILRNGENLSAANKEAADTIAQWSPYQQPDQPRLESGPEALAFQDAVDRFVSEVGPLLPPTTDRAGQMTPSQVAKSLDNVTDVLSSADSTDVALSSSVRALATVGRFTVTHQTFDHLPADQQEAAKEAWNAWGTQFRSLNRQIDRFLSHPNAAASTLQSILDHGLVHSPEQAAAVGAHPAFEVWMAQERLRREIASKMSREDVGAMASAVGPSAWQRARRFRSEHPSLGVTLAFADPDPKERAEALRGVHKTFQHLTMGDREFIAQNIDRLPGSDRDRQRLAAAVADSVSDSWKNERYHRSNVAESLGKSKNPKIAKHKDKIRKAAAVSLFG